MGLRDYTSKEVLNKVLYNNTALRAYSLSEGLNTILDAGNNRLKVRLEGGTVAGDLIVTGTLEVQGATTIIKSETIQVTDKTFELAVPSSGSPSDATSDGGGIILKGSTDKTILWNNANDWWNFNQGINVTGNAVVSGTVTSTFIGNVTGNVSGTAPAGTLTGATLASGVTASSLTSVGTLTGLTIENATNPLIVGDGTKDLYFDPDSNGVMVSTATSQGGDGHYYNDASGEVWTTIDGTAKVKVKASAFEVTPNATFSGDIRTIGTGVRTIRLESTTNAQNLNLDFFSNANAIAGRITYQEGAGAFYFQPNQAGGGTALTLDWSNNATFSGDVTMSQSGQAILHLNSSLDASEVRLTSNQGTWSMFSDNVADAFLINDGTTRFTLTDTSATFAGAVNIASTAVINSAGSDGQLYFGGTSGTNRMYVARSGGDSLLWNVDNGVIKFGTNNAERMRIDTSGNLALKNGTLSAEAGSGGAYATEVHTELGASTTVISYLDSLGGASWTGQIRFRTSTGGGSLETKMTLAHNGDVDLNTDVYANNIGGDTFRNLNIRNDGRLGVDTSSKRYKKNIKDISDISWIYDLRPVDFEWKETNKKDWGLIAEEVLEVNPRIVGIENEVPEWVDYKKLIPILLKAVQELSSKVEELEKKCNCA